MFKIFLLNHCHEVNKDPSSCIKHQMSAIPILMSMAWVRQTAEVSVLHSLHSMPFCKVSTGSRAQHLSILFLPTETSRVLLIHSHPSPIPSPTLLLRELTAYLFIFLKWTGIIKNHLSGVVVSFTPYHLWNAKWKGFQKFCWSGIQFFLSRTLSYIHVSWSYNAKISFRTLWLSLVLYLVLFQRIIRNLRAL